MRADWIPNPVGVVDVYRCGNKGTSVDAIGNGSRGDCQGLSLRVDGFGGNLSTVMNMAHSPPYVNFRLSLSVDDPSKFWNERDSGRYDSAPGLCR